MRGRRAWRRRRPSSASMRTRPTRRRRSPGRRHAAASPRNSAIAAASVGRATGSGSARSRRAGPAGCRGARRGRTRRPPAARWRRRVHCRTSVGISARPRRGRRGCRTGRSAAANAPGDLRVGAAEALGQLRAQLGPVGVAHDHRRHRRRPAEVVAVQRLEQLVDVGRGRSRRRSRRRRCSAARGRPAPAGEQLGARRRAASTPIMARHRVADEDHVRRSSSRQISSTSSA